MSTAKTTPFVQELLLRVLARLEGELLALATIDIPVSTVSLGPFIAPSKLSMIYVDHSTVSADSPMIAMVSPQTSRLSLGSQF